MSSSSKTRCTPLRSWVWVALSDSRRASASFAFVAVRSTSLRFSPRWGVCSCTLRSARSDSASASSSALLDLVRQEDQARRRLVVIELRQEGGQNVSRFGIAFMAREKGLVAPVLTGPEEEDLDTGFAAILGDGDDIGLLHPVGIDALIGGHGRNRADPVAQLGGGLEIHCLGRLAHAGLQFLAQGVGAAAQEVRRLLDQFVIGGRFDQIDTGPGTSA